VGGGTTATPSRGNGDIQQVPQVRGSRRDSEKSKRGLIYALDSERASRLLQEAREGLTPAIREALKVKGYQPYSLWEEAIEATRESTLRHLLHYNATIEPCYYSKTVYDTFLDVGLDLFILGRITGIREERARRKRGKAY